MGCCGVKKKYFAMIIVIIVLILTLCLSLFGPTVVCRVTIPEHYLDAIESQAKGVYSRRVPLLPIYVSVDSFSEEIAYYTIHYFPFGTIGMSYTENDGYNIEKPLTRF